MIRDTKSVTLERTLTQDDFDRFAALSGDDNRIHVDPAYSSRTRFGRTVAHGMFLYTILRGMLERLVPGSRLHSQHLKFSAPTYAGDPMRFTAEIRSDSANRVVVAMTATRIVDQVLTCEGLAEVQRQETS